MKTASYLTLDNPTPDRALARRLPAELARRYRALPVAQANGRITVVMADPNDQSARAAVVDALTASGSQGDPEAVYVVQGDPTTIDAWLAELWPAPAAQGPAIWLWQQSSRESDQVATYAEDLAVLLAAPLFRLDPAAMAPMNSMEACAEAVLLLSCSEGDALGRWLPDAESGPATLLVYRPRWPLRKLLVIVRGDEVDDCALSWAARLARPTGAAITALMVAPPAMNGLLEPNGVGIPALLSPAQAVGRKMQHAAQALADLHLDGILHLRQGAPEVVIREELSAAPYDLVIAGIAIRSAEGQWRLRPLLDRLLPHLACPLLLTGAGNRQAVTSDR